MQTFQKMGLEPSLSATSASAEGPSRKYAPRPGKPPAPLLLPKTFQSIGLQLFKPQRLRRCRVDFFEIGQQSVALTGQMPNPQQGLDAGR